MWATSPISRWRVLAPLALFAGLAFASSPAEAQSASQRARLEGAFLVNFVRFTQWPPERFEDPRSPYVLTVVGSEGVAEAVREVAEAAGVVHGRRIRVRRVGGGAVRREPAVLRGSHLVFVHRSAGVPARDVIRAVQGTAVLTVGDSNGFVDAGGMLGLVAAGPRVTFVANPEAMRAGGLSVSAKVLKLAQEPRG